MKLFTLILTTTILLATSSVSSAQTSFISMNSVENQQTVSPLTGGSIKFNLVGIANGIVKVKMFNQPEGTYTVELIDADGKLLDIKEIHHVDSKNLEVVDFGKKLEGGSYQVAVVNPDNKKTVQTIMLLM